MKKIFIALVGIAVFLSAFLMGQNKTDLCTTSATSNFYTIIDKPQIILMGIQCRTSNAPDAAACDIPQLWERFFTEKIFNKIPHKASNEIFALYCDYEKDYSQPYTFVIGCPVLSTAQIPEGMVVKIIPAASYALFPVIGENPQNIVETWQKIWQSNIHRTYTGDFEVYGEKFFQTPKEVDIFIAIQKPK